MSKAVLFSLLLHLFLLVCLSTPALPCTGAPVPAVAFIYGSLFLRMGAEVLAYNIGWACGWLLSTRLCAVCTMVGKWQSMHSPTPSPKALSCGIN